MRGAPAWFDPYWNSTKMTRRQRIGPSDRSWGQTHHVCPAVMVTASVIDCALANFVHAPARNVVFFELR